MGVSCVEFVCTPLLVLDVADLRWLSDLRVDTFENDNWAAERLFDLVGAIFTGLPTVKFSKECNVFL